MSIGFHVNKTIDIEGDKRSCTLPEAIEEDIHIITELGMNPCAQIFVIGPRNHNELMDDKDIIKCRHLVDKMKLLLVIHGAYIDNPWNMKPGTIHNIKKEMVIAERIGANGVIIHLAGAAMNDDVLKYIFDHLNKLDKKVKQRVILWLEIQSTKIHNDNFATPEKIRDLFNLVAIYKGDVQVGLVVDTAHLHACGVSLDTYDKAMRWLSHTRLMLDTIPIIIHLNDNKTELGSGTDIHCKLTKGNIWGIYNKTTGYLPIEKSGIAAILKWAKKENSMVIFERSKDGALGDLLLMQELGF